MILVYNYKLNKEAIVFLDNSLRILAIRYLYLHSLDLCKLLLDIIVKEIRDT